jgi:hypothetical protein
LIWNRQNTSLVSVSGRVICGTVSFSFYCQADIQLTLWTDYQTTTFLRATVDGLDNINQLLLILQDPVQLIVISGTEIAHHVFIAEEEHEGDGIVEFYGRGVSANLERKTPRPQIQKQPHNGVLLTVHLLEVGDLIEITDVDNSKVLDTVGNAYKEVRGSGRSLRDEYRR